MVNWFKLYKDCRILISFRTVTMLEVLEQNAATFLSTPPLLTELGIIHIQAHSLLLRKLQ